MTLNLISTEQCIAQLHNYASKEVRSWNPFKLFRKEKLKNHSLASDTAKLLGKEYLSNKDLLKIARTIDNFEDSQLQHDLLCLLHTKINESKNSFVTKRANINLITNTFQDLLNRRHSPWWTLFLFEVPFYSYDFRNNVKWIIGNINNLFVTRRTETKQHLIQVYSNEEIVNQIISEYHTSNTDKDIEQQKELAIILDITLEQTADQTLKVLIKEIQKNLLKEIPFGQVLISAAVLGGVINSYLSKKDNQTKSKQIQAQEILYIIGTIFLKKNASLVAKSFIPGVGELVEAVVSVTTSKSKLNPLHTDQKIGTAVASVTGGAIGGAIGTAIPFIGTYVGAYVGAVVSKTAATRFYQVLEAWQKAPRGPKSIIPGYNKAYITLVDNDAKNILNPLYKNYLETEKTSKLIGDEIAKWLCIYTLLQNSADKPSEECLEIINEEMNRLKLEFMKLKNQHAKTSLYLFSKKPDNSERVLDYRVKVKECLQPLHQPIVRMLDEYFSPNLKKVSTPSADSYSLSSAVELNDVPTSSLNFFPKKSTITQSTKDSEQTSPKEPIEPMEYRY